MQTMGQNVSEATNAAVNLAAARTSDARTTPRQCLKPSGWDSVEAAKTLHFEKASGYPRGETERKLIEDAAYRVSWKYHEAEDLFYGWGVTEVAASHAALYIGARIDYDEAVDYWEDQFRENPEATAAALEMLAGLLPRPAKPDF